MSCAKTFHEKSRKKRAFTIAKADDDKRLVFGWASVPVRVTGEVARKYDGNAAPDGAARAIAEISAGIEN